MAGMLDIPKGTKLKLAMDNGVSENGPDFSLISTFFKPLDDATFLISVPMTDGKSLELDEAQKFIICYTQGGEDMIVSAYPDYLVKDGIRKYWKMRRISEFRKFFKRLDERVKIALRVEYTSDDWKRDEKGNTELRDGITLDISAGGAAIFLSHQYNVGDFCDVSLPRVGNTPEGQSISGIVSNVCWVREAPKGSPYRNICGVQFRFADATEKEVLKNYVKAVKEKFKL